LKEVKYDTPAENGVEALGRRRKKRGEGEGEGKMPGK
jgi:hypothetical protein